MLPNLPIERRPQSVASALEVVVHEDHGEIQHEETAIETTSPDAQLRETILGKLAQRGIRPSRDFQLEVQDGAVFFRGRVQSFYQRQLIVHSVRHVEGVGAVHQAIEVVPPAARKPASTERASGFNFRRVGKTVALLTITLLLSSCSKGTKSEPVYPVEGQVFFNGSPTPGAYVVFHPIGKTTAETIRPSAHVQPDGSFHIGTFTGQDGAPEGNYVVTVEWRKLVTRGQEAIPGRNVLPAKYSKPDTSDLHVNVSKGTNSLPPLQLSATTAEGSAVR